MWRSAADTHLKLLYRVVSGARFLTGGMYECDITHCRSVAVLCKLDKIRCNLMHSFVVLYMCRMCQCGLLAVLWSHIGILIHLLAAEPRSTVGPLFPSLCPCGTILLALYSTVLDCRVSRARPMIFYRPKLLDPTRFFVCYFFISVLSVYRLVL